MRFLIVMVGLALVSGFACKPKAGPDFELRDTVADAPVYSKIQLKLQADPETGRISGKFRYSDASLQAGQKVTLVYDVVSNGSPVIRCSTLKRRAEVTLLGQGKVGEFNFQVDPKAFVPPMQPDPKHEAKWDMSDERLWNGPMRVEGCFMNPEGATLGMAAVSAQGESGFALQGGGQAINLHGDQCAAKLGAIPAFDCMDDRYFKTIPVTQTNMDGDSTEIQKRVDECDNPIYLPTGGGGSCKPWARIGRIPTGEDSYAAVVCRRYWPEGGDAPNPAGAHSGVPAEFLSTSPEVAIPGSDSWKRNPASEEDPFFNDVAIIQHNVSTGETCFFQALGVLYARRVPPPTEREVPEEVQREHPYAKNAASFWLTPDGTANINCINCHDADPWMHSPYVRQVKNEEGETVVPSSWDLGWPERYVIIGSDFGFKDWTTAYTVEPEADGTCVSCHGIGSIAGCERWAQDAGSGFHYQNYKTLFGKSFPQSHWMPPDFEGTQADWERRWKAGYDAIVNCCNVKDDAGQKILGVRGMFGAEARYGKSLNEQQLAKLEAAGCFVEQRSFVE